MSGTHWDTATPQDTMTRDEAMAWLEQVEGELYRTPGPRTGGEAWVAVVRTPGQGARRGQLIVALGNDRPRIGVPQVPAEQLERLAEAAAGLGLGTVGPEQGG